MQGGACFFCKKTLSAHDASVEHLVARSNGGNDRDENCVACCKTLNTLLGRMSLKEKIQVFLNQQGRFECPNGVHTKPTKSAPNPKKSSTEYYTQVVANLKQRGSAKPSTVATLKSTIAAHFKNKLSTDQVETLIQQLESRGVISIETERITYA
jgi:hypothetical protein